MIGGATRCMLPHLSGVPHIHDYRRIVEETIWNSPNRFIMKTQNGQKVDSLQLIKVSEEEVLKAMHSHSNPIKELAVKMVLLEPEI